MTARHTKDFRCSVIMPCYNAEETLSVQLEALADQSITDPWEMILVDNGSTDNSSCIAEEYQCRIANLIIIRASKRQGAGYARNEGVAQARSQHVAICDADDIVDKNWVAAMAAALETHGLVSGRLLFDKLNNPALAEQFELSWQKGVKRFKFWPYAVGCNMGVRRDLHDMIGGWDENFLRADDLDYSWRLKLKGIEPYYEPDAIVHYRIGRTKHSVARTYRFFKAAGESHYFLYKRFKPYGMPPRRANSEIVCSWLKILIRMPLLARGKFRTRIKHEIVKESGYLAGMFRGFLNSGKLAPV